MSELMTECADTAHRALTADSQCKFRGAGIIIQPLTINIHAGVHRHTVRPYCVFRTTFSGIRTGVVNKHIINDAIVVEIILGEIHSVVVRQHTGIDNHLHSITIISACIVGTIIRPRMRQGVRSVNIKRGKEQVV